MEEKKLYPVVQRYIESKFRCFETKQMRGNAYIGNADVIGVRDVGGVETGDIEIVTVEVKTKLRNFGKILGQALGYSLMAHRCYLAVLFNKKDDGFEEEYRILANKMGVGLIEIRKRNNEFRCKEVLSSRLFNPDCFQISKVGETFKLSECNFCGNYFRYDNKKEGYVFHEHITKRPLIFSKTKSKNPKKYSGICWNCIKRLKKIINTNKNKNS